MDALDLARYLQDLRHELIKQLNDLSAIVIVDEVLSSRIKKLIDPCAL